MGDRSRGLFGKFIIKRADGSHRKGQKHADCRYFVLDVTHDPHAIPALLAYAESAEKDGYGLLASDLRAMVKTATPAEDGGCLCGHPKEEHNETGCMAVIADLGAPNPDVFCACPRYRSKA